MTNNSIVNSASCSCCGDFAATSFNRRRFLHFAAGSGLALAFPQMADAASGNYEAMLLCCIDPRFPERTLDYMKGRNLFGKYSQFSIAGAAIGVVAPAFKASHKAFWDNLAASIELHRISVVSDSDH